MYRVIESVFRNSIADRHGIRPGDELLSINGEQVLDYIDYAYFMGEKTINLRLRRNVKEQELLIKKEDWEDIGLVFADSDMGQPIRCKNKCMFCFVNQLPRGMRKSLYVKDDDWRMSFLMGNYVTLTNLSWEELNRIIKRKVSPLYVSVHSTDDTLRGKLLGNQKAPSLLPLLKLLIANGIRIHAQVVVCEGINDGEALKETIRDLFNMHPGVGSVAVVPVGLTKYRERLPQLLPISEKNANNIIDNIQQLQDEFFVISGTRFVFASDEMYIRAKRELPVYSEYEDFMQIENGVGLIAKFADEISQGIADFAELKYRNISIACGLDVEPFMKEIAKKLNTIYNININVYGIQNDFFGQQVTVTGLLTGGDIIKQLKHKDLGEKLFLSGSIFKQFEEVTLDNITLEQISQNLKTPCQIAPCDGYEWMSILAGEIE